MCWEVSIFITMWIRLHVIRSHIYTYISIYVCEWINLKNPVNNASNISWMSTTHYLSFWYFWPFKISFVWMFCLHACLCTVSMMSFECVGLLETRVTNGYKTLWAYWEPCLGLLKDLQVHLPSDYFPSSLIYVLTLLISFIFTILLKYF